MKAWTNWCRLTAVVLVGLALAQWKRDAKPAERMEDIVTMGLRYGANETRFVNDSPGWIAHQGLVANVQHKGKLLAIGSPTQSGGGNMRASAEKTPIKSMQTSIALMNYQEPRTWEIYVGDTKVSALPVKIEKGQSVTIRDGVTFFAATPIDGADLGRDAFAILREGDAQTWQNVVVNPALVLDVFNYRNESKPLGKDADWNAIDLAYSGFAVEIADAADYNNDFAAFRKHVSAGKVETKLDEKAKTVTAVWTSGQDTIQSAFDLVAPHDRPGKDAFRARTVNGKPASLPAEMERDTTVDQQGRGGRLEKNGAVITNERGSLAALMTNPSKKIYVGMIPLPDAQLWAMKSPSGIFVTADDRLAMARVTIDEANNSIDIQSFADPSKPAREGAYLIRGASDATKLVINGKTIQKPAPQNLRGQPTLVIPISADRPIRPMDQIERRLERFEQVMSMPKWPDFMRMQVDDWWYIGPFPKSDTEEFGPERTTSLDDLRNGREYQGVGSAVRWTSVKYAKLFNAHAHRGTEIFRAPRGPAHKDPLYPKDPITGYIAVGIRADEAQDVTFNLHWWGSARKSQITLFLNGQEVKPGVVSLKKGDNVMVLRTRQKQAAETGDLIRFSIGDPIFGIPTVRGVQYVTPGHTGEVNPVEP